MTLMPLMVVCVAKMDAPWIKDPHTGQRALWPPDMLPLILVVDQEVEGDAASAAIRMNAAVGRDMLAVMAASPLTKTVETTPGFVRVRMAEGIASNSDTPIGHKTAGRLRMHFTNGVPRYAEIELDRALYSSEVLEHELAHVFGLGHRQGGRDGFSQENLRQIRGAYGISDQ